MSEIDLTHKIIKTLNSIPGVMVWRRNVGRRGGVQFGKKGMADIEGVARGGRRIEIEVKLESDLSAEQTQWLDQMARMGAITGVVYSIWDAVEIIEKALKRG